tara:strand:+ start:349 stop:765 length:417 start_codon:yes stop_codon:yes gene_type:complete
MILISHRGNLSGPNPEKENKPEQIYKVLNLGYQCEVDIWKKDGDFYLGHHEPQYKIDLNLLNNKNLWIHAKNLEALYSLPKTLRYFWHQTDDYTLTSDNFIWTFPDKKTCERSVIVDKNKNWRSKNYKCLGVCTDWIL